MYARLDLARLAGPAGSVLAGSGGPASSVLAGEQELARLTQVGLDRFALFVADWEPGEVRMLAGLLHKLQGSMAATGERERRPPARRDRAPAQVAFLAGWLIAETWQGPRYSPVADTISDLQAATAPHYWFPVACFAAGGLGTFGFAVLGLRPALAGAGRTAARAPWVLACAALALGNSFPLIPCRLADPGCTAHHQLFSAGGLTDAVLSGVAFLVLALTPFPLWRRLAVLPQWRRVRSAMLTARIVCPVS